MEKHKENITKFYESNFRMPFYSELLKITGFKSKNAVFKLINKLIGSGYTSKDSKGHLVPNESLIRSLARSHK